MRYVAGVVMVAFGTSVAGVVAGIWILRWAYAQLQKSAAARSARGDDRDIARRSRYAHDLFKRMRTCGLFGAAMLVIGVVLIEASHR